MTQVALVGSDIDRMNHESNHILKGNIALQPDRETFVPVVCHSFLSSFEYHFLFKFTFNKRFRIIFLSKFTGLHIKIGA